MAVVGALAPRHGHITKGTPAFRRANLAMFSAGFSTFALLNCVQPLLPIFSREFGVSATESSLSVSLTTGTLAFGLLIAGLISDTWGRKPVMVVSLIVSALLTLALSFITDWHGLLSLRLIAGFAFSGLPAIAMGYLSEEMDVKSIGLAMGLYVAGGTVGGMFGRLFTGVFADIVSWRFAVGTIGALGLIASFVFWRSLPPSSNFYPQPFVLRGLFSSFLQHLHDSGLRLLFLEGFLLAGGFVTVYNFMGYRLESSPYHLSQSVVGLVFGVYLFGTISSGVVGNLSAKIPRRTLMLAMVALMFVGVATTLMHNLILVISGVALITAGFFGAHSMLSSWVGLRAQRAKAQASSLYLFLYYMGSSVLGSFGGFFWGKGGWTAVVCYVSALLTIALYLSLRLIRVRPIGHLR